MHSAWYTFTGSARMRTDRSGFTASRRATIVCWGDFSCVVFASVRARWRGEAALYESLLTVESWLTSAVQQVRPMPGIKTHWRTCARPRKRARCRNEPDSATGAPPLVGGSIARPRRASSRLAANVGIAARGARRGNNGSAQPHVRALPGRLLAGRVSGVVYRASRDCGTACVAEGSDGTSEFDRFKAARECFAARVHNILY